MQKATLLVITALLAVASSTNPKEEKKHQVSKPKEEWEFKLPYLSRKYSSSSIAKGKTPVTRSKKSPPVSKTPATPSVSKREDITQVPATNADIPEKEASPSISENQVLVLKVIEKKDQRLILERKNGQNLDWSFFSLDNNVENEVKAHKSIVLKYSSYLRNICQIYADHSAQKNSFPFYYPSRIIDSLLTLLYEHSVTINKSDYDSIMAGAKVLQIDQLIGVL